MTRARHKGRDLRYPYLNLGSKADLARALSNGGLSRSETLALINDVLKNHDRYWHDIKTGTDPAKGKFCRSAKGYPLSRLLGLINKQLLAPHDNMVPRFVFGSLKERSGPMAVAHLLGSRRNRTLLRADVATFFESVDEGRVVQLFKGKFCCSIGVAKILARICCVPRGYKHSPTGGSSIARGFATSPRLALWCNLDLFKKMDRLVSKRLKGKDARIAIYVDDIGITASRVTKELMLALYDELDMTIFREYGRPKLNSAKKEVVGHGERPVHLGCEMRRGEITVSPEIRSKMKVLKQRLDDADTLADKKIISRKLRSHRHYKRYVESKPKMPLP